VLDEPAYWAGVHGQPVAFWQPALDVICQNHNLVNGQWQRFSLGKNAVFALNDLVVKLSPPFWVDDLRCETEVLRFIAGKLPVATPDVVAVGELDTWAYLVMSRVPGEALQGRWSQLERDIQLRVARQHGEIMAALHQLPLDDGAACATFPWWKPMLADQRTRCLEAMKNDGVDEILLNDLDTYLDSAQPLLDADTANEKAFVLLHGDLTSLNLQVDDRGNIIGLIDWGDAKIGPIAHEFISPGTHFYRGDQEALHQWYAGYGLKPTADLQRNVMARSMLYYAGDGGYFARVLNAVPGASECRTWDDVAVRYWQMG
jgi:hygromycin-B 7''-O-kinase